MAKFEIVAGKPFESVFVLKSPGTTTPLTLVGTETGEFSLTTLTGPNDPDPTKVLTKAMTLGTLINGEFKLALTDVETTGLEFKVGFIEDSAPFKPNYRANLSFYNGDGSLILHAQIPDVVIVSEGV